MRRTVALGLLFLCAIAVVFLLLQTGSPERAGGRRHEAGTDAAGGGPDRALPGDEAVEAAGGEAAPAGAAGRDDDPNRVPGADLVLRGRVVRDNAGVEGATVTARRALPPSEHVAGRWALFSFETLPPPIATTTSGEGGCFELRIARRSRVILHAVRPGKGFGSLFLLMPATGDPPEVLLKLRPGSAIEGIVVNEAAEPVAGASVALGPQDWSRPVVEVSAQTDEAGRFAFEDVPDGQYRARVQADGYPETRHWVNVPLQKFLRVELRPAGVIVGKVADGDGTAIAKARVLISTSAWERGGASGAATAETDGSGAYRIEIYPGAVSSATVDHPRFGRHSAGAETFGLPTALVETGKELTYDIRLRPGVPLRGRVVFAGVGNPAPAAVVTLLRMAQQWRGLADVDSARADEEGRFEFPYVTEGTYALDARAEGAARLASRQAQAGQPMTIDLFVDGETPPPEQRLELLPCGAVHGHILGFQTEPDANRRPQVSIQAQTGYLGATVDDLGAFEFTHVPVMEGAVVQSWNPQAKSDPFGIEAGKVTEVDLDATRQGAITGVVEDEDGNPVARARVQVLPQSQLQQQLQQFVQQGGWGALATDDAGRFAAPVSQWSDAYWRGQKFVVVAHRQGYALAMSDPLGLPEEGRSETLRLVLRGGGLVRGRIEHAAGGPAVNVSVTASPKAEPNAPFETRGPITTYSDADGRFEIRGAGDGIYQVSAWHPQGKVEAKEARAGDEDVRLVIQPALAISGVVVTETGRPVAQAQVTVLVTKERGEVPRTAQTGGNGRFHVGQLDAGSCAVEVTPNAQNWGIAVSFEKKRVEDVAAGSENVVIVVAEGAVLRGKVEDGGGRPIASAGVIAMAPPAAKGQPPPSQRMQQSRPAAVTNGRGEFEIKGLGQDEIELVAVADGFVPATQRAAAGGAPITLRLEPGAVLEGRILRSDGTPLARQPFWVNGTSPETVARLQDLQSRAGQVWNYLGGWSMSSGQTDGEGRFRLASLIPGEYRLQVQAGDDFLPPAILRTGASPVTLRLERALTIRGRVTGPDGSPIAQTATSRVYVNARRGEQWLSGTTAGDDGRFELRGMPTGTVTLQVWAGQDYKHAQLDVASGRDDVSIVVERNEPKPPAK
jgi:hypothetical protein